MSDRKLARGVAVVGAGMSKFGPAPAGVTSRDLFATAYREMLASTGNPGFSGKDIEGLYVGNVSNEMFEHQMHLAPILADWIGLVPGPAVRIEDACASSGVALREAVLAIASGAYDVVLAGGLEKMTNLPTADVTEVLAYALDGITEYSAGFTFPGVYGAMATAHMGRWGTTTTDLIRVAIKNHANAALNPNAHFNTSIEDLMQRRREKMMAAGKPAPAWENNFDFLNDNSQNPVIAWPLRLFDCSTVCDGAACVLLAASEVAAEVTDQPLYITGTGQASDYPLHDRTDLSSIAATREAARQAYTMAHVKAADVGIAEVHDCFTIAEIIAVEDLGFFAPGAASAAVRNGVTAREGSLPVNTGGGLKAKGHPLGATGAAQVVELWEQMHGRAGARQVPGNPPEIGLAHNVGAHGTTAVVHILQRRQSI